MLSIDLFPINTFRDINLLYFYYLKSYSLWTVFWMHLRNIAIIKIRFPLFAESELCMRLVCGPNREYTMHITDNNGQVSGMQRPLAGDRLTFKIWVGYLFNKPASRKVFQWKLYFCSGGDESSPQLRVLRGMLLVCNRLFLWVWSPNRGSCGKHYRICQTAVRKIYCIHWQFFFYFCCAITVS